MLSKEEVLRIIAHCKDTGQSYKERCAELGVKIWQFHAAKAYYKLLHWEPGGLVLYSKLLEAGTLGKPSVIGEDGSLQLDNNLIENATRPLGIGRKNWLFCANEDSATRAAIVYTLIACCKIADVDPSQWMEDILRKLPYYKRDNKDLTELLPENWEKSRQKQN